MARDLAFTDEHEELRATLRAFLQEHSGEAAVRAHMASARGYDLDVWRQLAEQLGLAGLVIPEEYGGAGMGYVELLVVMEELGRALCCSPFLSTAVLATNTLLHCAEPTTRKELLVEIAAGRTLATLAYVEPNGRWDVGGISMRAKRTGDGFALTGSKCHVIDGHTADVILVAAQTDAGVGVFRVAGDARGLTRTPVPELDLTRKLARLDFDATPAAEISQGDQSAALERVLALAATALAAEQAGGAQACLDMAVGYAKTRLQFGRPIGSYQSIKHKCADMLVGVEMAKSAAYQACFAAADDAPDFLEYAALAKSYCSEAYFHAAADTIQIHGGMGFTWEHPAHLYFKRAKASELLFGDASHHRELLADRIGL
jgi:alkylation response protein AidB-like acyl-CoA dehydrogenase